MLSTFGTSNPLANPATRARLTLADVAHRVLDFSQGHGCFPS